MADDRKKPEGEAAEAAQKEAKAAGGGLSAWLPLIIAVVLMPVLAFGVTKLLIVPQLQKSLGIKEAASGKTEGKAKAGAEGKKVSVPFNKLLVNVAGTMGSRYLLVSVTVVGTGGEEFKKKMDEEDAHLKDMAMSTLASKTLSDLEKPGARNLIRTELMNGFNNILGEDAVKEIYITEFGIQ
jgi:flagellar protein FliL